MRVNHRGRVARLGGGQVLVGIQGEMVSDKSVPQTLTPGRDFQRRTQDAEIGMELFEALFSNLSRNGLRIRFDLLRGDAFPCLEPCVRLLGGRTFEVTALCF